MKKLTVKQLETRKEEAARIARNAREEADRADYALQRATLENLKGEGTMAVRTRRELIERNKELEEENEELRSRLEEIGDLASPEEEEEDENEGE
ncbi:MAG TPA: hypothetical protein VG206_17690 [Terriglobia bacterium]|nr:hypothetical protein [Terriglobia bacterium]